MSNSGTARWLFRAATVATTLTIAVTFALLADEGSRRAATDQALSVLLLTTLPIAACIAVWGAGAVVDPLVAFGKSRRRSLVRHFAPLLWGFPLTMVVLSLAVLAWTRGPTDPRLMADVFVTVPVAAIAGAAISLVFLAIGQWFGRIGLAALLLVLLTFGRSELVAAASLPSAHVRHLLGVGATLPFDPGWSMAALWSFSLLALSAWLARVPD